MCRLTAPLVSRSGVVLMGAARAAPHYPRRMTFANSERPEGTGNPPSPVRLVVLFGGTSGEHPISCATAAGILRALDPQRYELLPVAITTDGAWVRGPNDPAALEGGKVHITRGEPVTLVRTPEGRVELRAAATGQPATVISEVDVVLPLLHGPFGEDGTVQGFFEMLGVRYVGSGVSASAIGMDKHLTKVLLAGNGLEVEPYVVISDHRWHTDREGALREAEGLRTPLFVKPCRAGSSLGISRVDDLADLPAAVEEARRHDPKVIIEQGVAGREIECGVLGGHGVEEPRVAHPGEVVLDVPEGAFYDYETKYFSAEGAVTMRVPADIPADAAEAMARIAREAYLALECEGLARVDFFLRPDGTPVINEINTMPGFTPFSMFPVMWQATGMTYRELVDELVDLALERPIGLR